MLVFALVLGTVGTAFAAVFPDTEGTKYEEAVALLTDIGLLKGFEDGTFRPAETITRAQVCAMAVRALGFEEAAEQAAAATSFTDVPATHWAAGYINIASSQGIVEGMGDGSFHPDDPVTYAQILTILVRLLGYEPVVTGTWPTGHLVKAYELGLPTGVSFNPNLSACRGDVALFFENALTVNLMEKVYTGALESWAVADPPKTLLEDRLGYASFTGLVTNVSTVFDSELEDGEVVIWNKTDDACGFTYEDATFDLLGKEVQIWHAENKVVALNVLTTEDDLVTGFVKAVDAGNETITVGKTEYEAGSALIVLNNTYALGEDLANISAGDEIVALVEDDAIIMAVVTSYDNSLLVTKVQAKYNRFKGKTEQAVSKTFDLDDYDDYAYILFKDGVLAEMDDIEVGDVIHYFEVNGYAWFEVVSEKVEGEVEAIETEDGEEVYLTVDGEEYLVSAVATLSTDENVTFSAYTGEDDLASFAGEEVTLYLDKWGDIRHIEGDLVVEAEDNLAVVKTEFYIVDLVKLFSLDGDTSRYALTEDTVLHGDAVAVSAIITGGDDVDNYFPIGTLVEFTLDKDGALATLDAVVPGITGTTVLESDIDADNNLFDGKRAGASTVFVDYANWKVYDWETFQTIDLTDNDLSCFFYDGGDATVEYVAFDGSEEHSFGVVETLAGVVIGRSITADGTLIKILMSDEGEAVTASYLHAASGDPTDLAAGDFITFTVVDGELTVVSEESFYAADFVYAVDEENMVITLTPDPEAEPLVTSDYLFTDDFVVFDVTEAPELADLGDVSADVYVELYDINSLGRTTGRPPWEDALFVCTHGELLGGR